MNYITVLKGYDDMRVFNREAFKMDQLLKFKLDNYIDYYNYDMLEDEEYPDDVVDETDDTN